MDSTDSWSGETELYSAHKSKAAALKNLESHGISTELYDAYEANEDLTEGQAVLLDLDEDEVREINVNGWNYYWKEMGHVIIEEVELED